MKLLLATHNPGKLREYRLLLQGLPLQIATLEELGIAFKVAEKGRTFEENARAKALAYCAASGLPTLAEDSGLEVEALGGEPGVLSARYAGEGASDAQRLRFLLSRLEGVPWERRGARFRCAIALARPGDGVETVSGEVAGVVALEPRGSFGFGYDPLFYLPELGKTMAQLLPEEKNRVSHRGQAARKARLALEQWALERALP